MNLYEVLHVSENAPEEVIKLAYKGLAQKYHPDRYSGSDANEKMVQIRKAYETLMDKTKRAEHDRYLSDIRNKAKFHEEMVKQREQEELFKKYQSAKDKNDTISSISSGNKKPPVKKILAYGLGGLLILVIIVLMLMKPKTYDDYNAGTDQDGEEAVVENLGEDNLEDGDFREANARETELNQTADESLNNTQIDLNQDPVLVQKVVTNFDIIYEEQGITGLTSAIDECYKIHSNMKYCLYLDVAGRYLDHGVAQSLNTDVNPFFEDENFGNRVIANFYLPMGVTDFEVISNHLEESNALVGKKLTELL